MRRSNKLYLSVFKPDRFFQLHSLESDQVKAERLFEININHIDCTDGPFKPSEGAIIYHTYPAAYRKYFYPIVCYLLT